MAKLLLAELPGQKKGKKKGEKKVVQGETNKNAFLECVWHVLVYKVFPGYYLV